VVRYELVIGGCLYIIAGLELAIEHRVFLHPHKRSGRICLAHRVAAAHLLLLPVILFNICWPVFLGIIKLLLYFLIDVPSLECLVYFIDCPGYFIGVYCPKAVWFIGFLFFLGI